MKIKRNVEQSSVYGELKLHEVMHEAAVNPLLYMSVEEPEFTIGALVTRQNEVNIMHRDGDFEQIVEESSQNYPFVLKLDDSEHCVDMVFDGREILIKNETGAEKQALLELASSLDADLLDKFNKVIAQPPKKKSLFSFLGF